MNGKETEYWRKQKRYNVGKKAKMTVSGNVSSKLITLAKAKFGNLTKGEEALLAATEKGKFADLRSQNQDENNPEDGLSWGDDRTIRSEVLAWLCTDRKAVPIVSHRGIQIKGAIVRGHVELRFADISFPLQIEESRFDGWLILDKARISGLYLEGSHTGPIIATGLHVEGNINLCSGFRAIGEVKFAGAVIEGDLDCSNGHFIAEPEDVATYIRVLHGQNLSCEQVKQRRLQSLHAIAVDRARISGNVTMGYGFIAQGQVSLRGAKIGGVFDCSGDVSTEGGHFNTKGLPALVLESASVESNVLFKCRFHSKGEVSLVRTRIGGNLECDFGSFIGFSKEELPEFLRNVGYESKAINADDVEVKGSVFMRNGFVAQGEVRLVLGEVGGLLDCTGGSFSNPAGIALNADSLKVVGAVFLKKWQPPENVCIEIEGFKCEGSSCFVGSDIGQNFQCDGAEFHNKGKVALQADGMTVQGSLFLRGHMKCDGAISLVGANIKKALVWKDIEEPHKTTLDLRSAHVGTLLDREKSWPPQGRLYLNGFQYHEISDDSPIEPVSRLKWLRLQKQAPFRQQPYEQLAGVLRKAGHEDEAKKVLIEKNKDRVKYGPKLSISDRLWYRLLGPLIGYGYSPLRVFFVILPVLLLGCLVFEFGFRGGVMEATIEKAHADASQKADKASSIAYSIDLFLPVVNLRQAREWFPDPNSRGECQISKKRVIPVNGHVLRWYAWFHIGAGWILTTILVLGLTGRVRT